MTTARVEHREYVPFGWIAVKFCDVDFFGDEAEFFESMWREIEYKKYNQVTLEIKRVQSRIEECRAEIDTIEHKLKQVKRWWRFWKTAEEKELKRKQSMFFQNIQKAKAEKDSLERNMFYKAKELVQKAENFLKENGFILTNVSSNGNECITYTDLWTRG